MQYVPCAKEWEWEWRGKDRFRDTVEVIKFVEVKEREGC